MKKFLSMLLVLAIMFVMLVPSSFAASKPIEYLVTVDGEPVKFTDGKPYKDESGRIQVPISFIASALGAKVEWIQSKKTAVFTMPKDNKYGLEANSVAFTVGEDWYNLNGRHMAMDTTANLKSGRVFAPIRFVSESFGVQVNWDSATNTVGVLTTVPEPEETDQPNVHLVGGDGYGPILLRKDFDDFDLMSSLVPYANEVLQYFGKYAMNPENEAPEFKEFVNRVTVTPTAIYDLNNREASEYSFVYTRQNLEDAYYPEFVVEYGEALLKEASLGRSLTYDKIYDYLDVYYTHEVTFGTDTIYTTVQFSFIPSDLSDAYLALSTVSVDLSIEQEPIQW